MHTKWKVFKEDWIYLGNRNDVTFTNLNPGTYTFQVKGSNNYGNWNTNGKSIQIKILPPLWRTWWAYLLYSMAFIGLIYAIIRQRVQKKVRVLEAKAKIERARNEERALLRKKNAADFHDELGHRLTKISLFLELAERQSNNQDSVKQYLEKIKTNSSGLSEGIRDLIWSLDPKKDTLFQTISRLQEFGQQLFEYSNIEFSVKGDFQLLETIQLAPEIRKHVLLIFKEVMNNALKYANATFVTLTVQLVGSEVLINCTDNGQGFSKKLVQKGYGLNNMQERAQQIGGDLKVESQTDKGTSISLNFKVPATANLP